MYRVSRIGAASALVVVVRDSQFLAACYGGRCRLRGCGRELARESRPAAGQPVSCSISDERPVIPNAAVAAWTA